MAGCTLMHPRGPASRRSEEHTSELQPQSNPECRLLLEKKKAVHCCNNNRLLRRGDYHSALQRRAPSAPCNALQRQKKRRTSIGVRFFARLKKTLWSTRC